MITALPPLPYAYDALEPYIDARTMETHYTKHHQTYLEKMNAVLAKYPDLRDRDPEDLLRNLPSLGMEDADRTLLINHGGGFVNHAFFWTLMGPKKNPDEELTGRIQTAFGDVAGFKKQFSAAAAGLFGSGWAWLVEDDGGNLKITTTQNQDSPLSLGQKPIIALDVWEHAYYLKYQNRRAEYIENWWNVLTVLE